VPTATHTPTPPPENTPTPGAPGWDLGRDLIGMWEYVEEDWSYWFDFLADERVVLAENGIRPYYVRDARTLVIRMPEGEWPINVLDLTHDRLTLQGVVNVTDHFYWVDGTPDLEAKLVGLWLDVSDEYPSIEFTANGIAIGDFGRGRYWAVSPNSVLVECDDLQGCAPYLAFGQPPGAPLTLRIYEVADGRLTLRGLRYDRQWTLSERTGVADLAAAIVGLWVDHLGSIELTDDGTWIEDNALQGSYEIVSDSTVWVEIEDQGKAAVVMELTDDRLTIANWGVFYEGARRVLERRD
jgi:hypothetical protein